MTRKLLVATLIGGIGAALAILFGGPAEAGGAPCEFAIHGVAMGPVLSKRCPGRRLDIFATAEELGRVREAGMQDWINVVATHQYVLDEFELPRLAQSPRSWPPCR
jgi:hypothetical protein